MTKPARVLIIGGGIGGLSAAIALQRKGMQAVVIEKNPEWSVYGVGIIQPSNALRALHSIGLEEACVAQGRGFLGWRFCDSEGNKMPEVASTKVAGPGFPPVNGITRSALHRILTEKTIAQGTEVKLGVEANGWQEGAGGIGVSFSDGSSGDFDLVIGADGAHSKTRSMLFGEAVKPEFTGQCVWRYNFERPRDLDWGAIFYGKTSKAGLVPMTDALMYMFLVTAEPGNPRMPPEQLHTLLRDRMSGYGGIIAGLREQVTQASAVVYRPMEALLAPEPWHRGRVLLIGDAAHAGTPHLAEGAAMATEDAVLLADMLADSTDIQMTLTRFTQRRMPRARLVYEVGLKLGEWEMAEFAGKPDPEANMGALFGATYAQLEQPI